MMGMGMMMVTAETVEMGEMEVTAMVMMEMEVTVETVIGMVMATVEMKSLGLGGYDLLIFGP